LPKSIYGQHGIKLKHIISNVGRTSVSIRYPDSFGEMISDKTTRFRLLALALYAYWQCLAGLVVTRH